MSALIGTRAHATAALDHYYTSSGSEEFKYVGSGCFRTAYLHEPTGVVYKVGDRRDSEYDNIAELKNVQRLRRMCYPGGWWSTHVRIPKTGGFRVNRQWVVAMQYIGGSPGADVPLTDDQRAELYWLGFEDMHGGNYRVEDGVIYPVDMGSNFDPKEDNFLWPEEREALRVAQREERRAKMIAAGADPDPDACSIPGCMCKF